MRRNVHNVRKAAPEVAKAAKHAFIRTVTVGQKVTFYRGFVQAAIGCTAGAFSKIANGVAINAAAANEAEAAEDYPEVGAIVTGAGLVDGCATGGWIGYVHYLNTPIGNGAEDADNFRELYTAVK